VRKKKAAGSEGVRSAGLGNLVVIGWGEVLLQEKAGDF
jgi:hypothetical protein